MHHSDEFLNFPLSFGTVYTQYALGVQRIQNFLGKLLIKNLLQPRSSVPKLPGIFFVLGPIYYDWDRRLDFIRCDILHNARIA